MGLGAFFGGVAESLGDAMLSREQMNLQQRHAMAMENLRNQNSRGEIELRGQVNDRNDASATARRTESTMQVNEQQGNIAMKRDNLQHGNRAALQDDEQDFRANQGQLDRQHDSTLLTLRQSGDRADREFADELDRRRLAGEIDTTFVDQNGEVVLVYRDGRTEGSGYTATDRDRYPSSGGLGVLGGLGMQPPAASPTPTPSSTPSARSTAGQAGQAGQAERPRNMSYTQSDAEYTARQNGVSVEEVHRQMRAAGYSLAPN